jgi:hypothetical protein
MRRLPAQGVVQAAVGADAWRISLGRRHGVVLGDRFTFYTGTVERRGDPSATGMVREVDATSAVVQLEPGTKPPQALTLNSPVERIGMP